MTEAIKALIEQEAEREYKRLFIEDDYTRIENELIVEYLTKGYSLAEKQLQDKDAEIERLKGLTKEAYYRGGSDLWEDDLYIEDDEFEQAWQHFKTKHNL